MNVVEARWNRHIGWLLLVSGFVWAIWLDPWSLSEAHPAALPGSARMAARQAQAVVVGMAFLQLILGSILAHPIFSAGVCRFTACITGAGAIVYSLGYALAIGWPSGTWLIPVGALFNAVGFGLLARICWTQPIGAGEQSLQRDLWGLRVVLVAITFGMLIDAMMGVFAASPSLMPTLLGAEDGVRLRMLRLARAAAIALSVLALLYGSLMTREGQIHSKHAARGRVAMLAGALGMPVILSLAAFTSVHFKYLLPLPAFSIFYGTIIGAVLARLRGLEFWGWALIGASMSVGLTMGLYAFDGPVASPGFLGEYNDFARRLSRLGHAYCIVLGLLGIFLSREMEAAASQEIGDPSRRQWLRSAGTVLLMAGTTITVVVIVLVACAWLPTWLLGVGPAVVAVAALLCLGLASPPARSQS